mgnify:CR=1 FL=1
MRREKALLWLTQNGTVFGRQQGVKDLCWDVMTFIIENPVVQAEEAKQPEKVEFMWDDYHRQQLEEIAEEDDEDWDDDWDEDDEEGVEFIYKR